jgi:hypothetical protein
MKSGALLFIHITVVFSTLHSKPESRPNSSRIHFTLAIVLRSNFVKMLASSAKANAFLEKMLTVLSGGRVVGLSMSGGTAAGSKIPSICKSKLSLKRRI